MCESLCMPCAHRDMWRPEESVINGVTDAWELLCGCWEQSMGPMEEQQVLLVTDPSLQTRGMRSLNHILFQGIQKLAIGIITLSFYYRKSYHRESQIHTISKFWKQLPS